MSCGSAAFAPTSKSPQSRLLPRHFIPLPIIETPFERIIKDFVGPLPHSARDFRYLLVIMDYATRFPEAVPLEGMHITRVAQALLHFYSRVGISREILTDKGGTFTSSLMKRLCRLLWDQANLHHHLPSPISWRSDSPTP